MDLIRHIARLADNLKPVPSDVPGIYRDYYRSRSIPQRTHLCHAPFNNMYFNSLGEVANCWLTFDDPEVYDGTRTIRDIWNGKKFRKLREAIRDYNLDYRCGTCRHYIESGNHVNVLAKAYDNEFPLSEYPTMMEFELANTCNLECTMCNGFLSSAIRHNREKLPALKSPYGEKFIEELREFIPHLKEARFNGGEPFLIHNYYKIWDLIRELNPGLKTVVATNGTILNERVKQYLENGNFHINLSIDSLDPETYAAIRVNGNLEEVLRNFDYFKSYCQARGNDLCIMVNPMRQNWHELPAFVEFGSKHRVHLWFNTILKPYDQALWNLPAAELQAIVDTLNQAKFGHLGLSGLRRSAYNRHIFHSLVNTQFRNWQREAQEREKAEHRNGVQGAEPRSRFEANLESYLSLQYRDNPGGAAQARTRLNNKVSALQRYLQGRLSEAAFYETLNRRSPETIFTYLLEHSDENLMQSLDQFLGEQPVQA